MKKIFCLALSLTLTTAMLTACSLNGNSNAAEDTFNNSAYMDTSSTAEIKYSWAVNPKITADNIISFDGSQIRKSHTCSAYEKYSIYQLNGKYGLIDYSGNVVVDAAYDEFYVCGCGTINLMNVIDEKAKQYEYCSIDDYNNVVKYSCGHDYRLPDYYWDKSTNKVYLKYRNEDFGTEYDGTKVVVCCEATVESQNDGKFTITPTQNHLYGLAKKDKLVTELKYKNFYAPVFRGVNETAVAFEDDNNKWGYVNLDGKVLIDFKFDGDSSSYCGIKADNADSIHPYLFSDGYVVVLNDNYEYQYYDTDGKCVVPANEFEQARPVNNGKAWVRKDGKWGVIKLGDKSSSEKSEKETAKATVTTKQYSYSYTTKSYSYTTASKKATKAEKKTTTKKNAKTTTQKVTSAVSKSQTTAQKTQQTQPQTSAATQSAAPQTKPAETVE